MSPGLAIARRLASVNTPELRLPFGAADAAGASWPLTLWTLRTLLGALWTRRNPTLCTVASATATAAATAAAAGVIIKGWQYEAHVFTVLNFTERVGFASFVESNRRVDKLDDGNNVVVRV